MYPNGFNTLFRLFIMLIMSCVMTSLYGQEPSMFNLNSVPGYVAAPKVFAFVDSKGMVWVKYIGNGDMGVFDGFRYRTLNLKRIGIPPDISPVYETKDGIWFIVLRNKNYQLIRYDQRGRWHKYDQNFKSYPYFYRQAELLILGTDDWIYTYSSKHNDFIKHAKIEGTLSMNHGIDIVDYTGGKFLLSVYDSISNKRYITQYPQNNGKITPLSKYNNALVIQNLDNYIYFKDGNFVSINHGKKKVQKVLYHGKPLQFVSGMALHYIGKSEGKRPTLRFQDNDEKEYLVQFNYDGSYKFLLKNYSKQVQIQLAQDSFGRYWAPSSIHLFRIDPSVLFISQQDKNMVQIPSIVNRGSDGAILFGGYGGNNYLSRFNGYSLSRISLDGNIRILSGTITDKKGYSYFFGEGTGLHCISPDKPRQITSISPDIIGYYFYTLSDDQTALGLNNRGLGIGKLEGGELKHLKTVGYQKGLLLDNVLTVSEDRAGRLWMGRPSQGIAVYDRDADTAVTWLVKDLKQKFSGLHSSFIDSENTLWAGTTNGLYKLSNPDQFNYLSNNVYDYLKPVSLPGNDHTTVQSMAQVSHYMAFGTMKGVYFMDLQYKGKRPKFIYFRYGKELQGEMSEQNAMLPDSSRYLWVTCNTGYHRFDISAFHFDTTKIEFHFDQIIANEDTLSFDTSDDLELPKGKRNLKIAFYPENSNIYSSHVFFNIFCINSHGDTIKSIIQTEHNEFEVENLPAGNYFIVLHAFKHNLLVGTKRLKVHVPKFLDERLEFYLGIFVLLLGIPTLIYYLRWKHKINLDRQARHQDRLKTRVLSSFLNPHFINNSLNWIHLKYRKDPETLLITSKLADSIEAIYSNVEAERTIHLLSKELTIVNNYIAIQKIRFGNEIQYQIDSDITQVTLDSIWIPALIIQIYIENAIEKGLKGRSADQKTLYLTLREDENKITVDIIDEGTGRENKEPESQRKGSTKVMAELIAIYSQYNQEKITIIYDDFILVDTLGKPYGTKVSIVIPKIYNYDIG